jgi:hypothetical protein
MQAKPPARQACFAPDAEILAEGEVFGNFFRRRAGITIPNAIRTAPKISIKPSCQSWSFKKRRIADVKKKTTIAE